jgi:hypothetical protein
VARITHEAQILRLSKEWRPLWEGVAFSVDAVAKHLGMSASNVRAIVEGKTDPESPRIGQFTIPKIKEALKELRGRCPHCYQRDLEAARKAYEHGSLREVDELRRTTETARQNGGVDIPDGAPTRTA